MIHAIQERGRLSNAHRWHLCSVAAQYCVLFAYFRKVVLAVKFSQMKLITKKSILEGLPQKFQRN